MKKAAKRKRKTSSAAEREAALQSRAARIMGHKGGKARLEKISPERRSEIARLGAEARWKDKQASSPIEPLLSVREVAEILRASASWVYQHLKAKPVIPHLWLGRRLRFRRAELEAVFGRVPGFE